MNTLMNVIYDYEVPIRIYKMWKTKNTALIIDPPGPLYRVITKRLKIYAKTSHTYICRESHFHFPQNRGMYSATNIGQMAIHLFILEKWKCSCDGCLKKKKKKKITVTNWRQQSLLSLEWIHQSDFLCNVYQSQGWCGSQWPGTSQSGVKISESFQGPFGP